MAAIITVPSPGMVELVDTSDLGSDAPRDGFESLYPDHRFVGFSCAKKKITKQLYGHIARA